MTDPAEQMAENFIHRHEMWRGAPKYNAVADLTALMHSYGEACVKEEWEKKISTWSNPFEVRKRALEEVMVKFNDETLKRSDIHSWLYRALLPPEEEGK